MDTFGPIGLADLVRVAGDPEEPGMARGDGMLLEDLTVDALAALRELLEDPGARRRARRDRAAPARRRAGAARGRRRRDRRASTRAGRSSPAASRRTPRPRPRSLAAVAAAKDRLAPFAAPGLLLNTTALGADPARAFAPEAWARLARAKAQHDPDDLILAAHRG